MDNSKNEEKTGVDKNSTTKEETVNWSFRSIFFGDVLINGFLKRQTKLLILLVVLTVFYISNRYSCQIDLIRIAELKQKLTDIKYNALTRSSELMEKSRQSRIEEYILIKGSDLQTSTTPPFVIKD